MTPSATSVALAPTPHERLADSRATLRQVEGLLDEFGGVGSLSGLDATERSEDVLRTSLMNARSEVLDVLDSVRRSRSTLAHETDRRPLPGRRVYAATVLTDVEDRLCRLLERFDLRRFGLDFPGEPRQDQALTGLSR